MSTESLFLIGEVSFERVLDVRAASGIRGRRGLGLGRFGAGGIRVGVSRGGGDSCTLSFSSVGDRGEKPAGGKTGCMLDDKPGGELGRNPFGIGGGVADIARGDDGLEVAGDEGRGEYCSTEGLPGFRGDGRYICK